MTTAEAPQAATSLVGDMRQLIPLAGLIDKEAERARLQKNIDKLEQDATAYQAPNSAMKTSFRERPQNVVDKEREKLAETSPRWPACVRNWRSVFRSIYPATAPRDGGV